MDEPYSEHDIEALSKIHHAFYYKLLHTHYEEQFPMIKDLTSLEMGVLGVLSETPGAMLREIAEKLAVPKSTITSVVDRLERRGYVNRAIGKQDRRSFELVLTGDGKAAQREHVASERGLYLRIAGALDTPEEVSALIALLQKIVDRV